MGPHVALNWTLTPAVPEPSAWALLAAGGVFLGAAARRRRRAA
ncbi:PEP-CTERM sorting domain-containing protein [Massilia dura]|uniref:PEP-CTERM sorting domain-containing protein n=2 Tax=Pseudoduganella dura TaxID=321982 RepID=A0A6I3XJT9_9BURK|nr:PEP-CTERM sorting domain-containing protein [Pseudoduganella dura]